MELSTPSCVFYNGSIVPWHEATVHVWSETAIRGTNVFEGLRAYWIPNLSRWRVVALDEHLRRLSRSLRLMRIPFENPEEYFREAIGRLMDSLYVDPAFSGSDLYLRPTVYIDRGSYGYDPARIKVGTYIVAFPSERRSAPVRHRYCVSSWRRAGDDILVPRAKVGAGYLNFRLARIEADERGLDDAILLTSQGKVAETGGACLLVVRGNRCATPSVTDGILESITRSHLLHLASELGLTVEERSVDRTELYVADEVIACGTLLELASVVEIDGRAIGSSSSVADSLFGAYRREIESGIAAIAGWLIDYDPKERRYVKL